MDLLRQSKKSGFRAVSLNLLSFFYFKDTIKELHDAPFFSYEHKTYSNMESGIISKPAFFPTSRSEAGSALEKQKLVENCQIFKATGG